MSHKDKDITKKWYRTNLGISLLLILAGTVGFIAHKTFGDNQVAVNDCGSGLTFIRTTPDCALSDKKSEVMTKLQIKLEDLIEFYTQNHKASKVGVFVRDLKTTRFAGVNDNQSFIMASLLKTPLVITAYKMAEIEPKILDEKILYTGKPNLYANQTYRVEDELKPGNYYTIKELTRRSIVYSDNTASELLFNAYPKGFFGKILTALGLQVKSTKNDDEDFTTPRSYANIFRVLYNSSYLTREYSNEILSVLSETKYKNGAIALIPSSVKVAHKFAERTVIDEETKTMAFKQLHECGLVYAGDGEYPYTFCIMTEGKTFSDLESIQQQISHTIYEAMAL